MTSVSPRSVLVIVGWQAESVVGGHLVALAVDALGQAAGRVVAELYPPALGLAGW